MVSIKVILDKRRAKADNSYPLTFQIYFNRKTRTRYTGISIKTDEWDQDNQLINKKHFNYKVLNGKIKKQLADLQSELMFTSEEVVENYLNPPKTLQIIEKKKPSPTVYQFAQSLIDNLRQEGKIGNAWVYEATVNALKGFHPNDDIHFENINYEFLDSYQRHLSLRAIKPNSIYLYVRTIRIFYNKAIKLKLVDKALYPFDDFKLKPEKTRKRALDKDLLIKIIELDIEYGSTKWHVRNWFILSFYLIGISIIDLALLTPISYKGGRIEYKRRKTGKWYDIKVHPAADQIINIYLHIYKSQTGYLLPIINYKTEQEEKIMRVVKARTKLMNKYIKQFACDIEYDGDITTYSVRHSWATIAKRLGFSNEVIAEALGHEYGNPITNVYLDNFEKYVVDNANETVINSIIANFPNQNRNNESQFQY